MSAAAVLHVTSLPGGGVDRHIRDIARTSEMRHLVWHAAETADVIEIASPRHFFALDHQAPEHRAAALAAWLRSQGVGLVHVHSLATAARRRSAWAAAALDVAMIATLHDVLFLRPDGFEAGAPREPDPQWLAQATSFLRGAAARVAPSGYLAALATSHLGLAVEVVPNGSQPAIARREPGRLRAHSDFLARRHGRVAAVLGAIGPHKGARVLEDAARLLEGSDIDIVLIGYLDAQVEPGWRNARLFVHGAYDDDAVEGLLGAYGAELAIFPNRVPESFSYALSDIWAAGLPAIVPSEGALAERVARHGGGWRLPAGFDAPQLVAELRRLLSPAGTSELARVKSHLAQSDPGRVPSLAQMTRSLDALYSRFGLAAAPVDPQSPPAQALLAANLDGALFRVELARLADEAAQERKAAADFAAEARGWIAKLERDVASLQAQLAAEVDERRRLGGAMELLEGANAQLRIHKDAFDLLPRWIRKWLLKKILDARN